MCLFCELFTENGCNLVPDTRVTYPAPIFMQVYNCNIDRCHHLTVLFWWFCLPYVKHFLLFLEVVAAERAHIVSVNTNSPEIFVAVLTIYPTTKEKRKHQFTIHSLNFWKNQLLKPNMSNL